VQIHSQQLCVLVIGTGRSGTHWIGNIVSGHREFRSTIEEPKIFRLVTQMALNPEKKKNLLPKLVRRYRNELRHSAPLHYLDKSHPNIWIAEELGLELDNSLFLGIERSVYATVSSMLLHPGVLRWQEKWREFPVPNHFLGIDKSVAEYYGSLSTPVKCTLRWISHRRQLDRLGRILGSRLLVVNYESLIVNTEMELKRIQKFLGLKDEFPQISVKTESLDRWRRKLSPLAIEEIRRTIREHGMEDECSCSEEYLLKKRDRT